MSLAVLSALSVRSAAEAQDSVPVDLQAVIFSKIFRYAKTLPDTAELRIAVVSGAEDADEADTLVAALSQAGLRADRMEPPGLDDSAASIHVAYLFRATASDAVTAWCFEQGILTLSADERLVRQGRVAIGLTLAKQRPKIVVHLERLRDEGHEVSAELLKLSEVIR